MSINWQKGIASILLGLFVSGVWAAKNSEIYHRSFWQPYFNGQRLAWCTADGKECGQPVANRYCRMMGYARADKQIKANNIGLANYISSSVRCTGWQCNGFKTIRCRDSMTDKPPQSWHYRLRRFVYPRFNNYRVDWCYDGATGCGRRAAYSFCRRLGFEGVRRYAIQKAVPATQAIGNQKLCFGGACQAFADIVCYR
ncbi:hypothetical protein [Legionella sp. CNM-4043-24]|uniref:hypothetical protein n=1 Tax=Legionella sp. CNM-4043-24 TaxID=3421646 RepID=UPI00403AD898